MNIMFVNSYYYSNSNGGAEIVCRSLAEELAKKGNKVIVVSIDSFSHNEIINGVKVYYIQTFIGRYRNRQTNMFVRNLLKVYRAYSIFDYFKYKRLIKNENIDIVHTHAIEDISPVIWKAARDCNARIIHTMHDYYIRCYKLFMLDNNGEHCCNPSIICKLRSFLYKPFLKMVNEFVSPSNSLRNDINLNCKVINNGVEIPTELDLVELRKERKKDHIILFVGSLNIHKGIYVLLDAFEHLDSSWKLYIAGDGDLYEEIACRIKKKDNIKLLGKLDKISLGEVYKKAYAVVVPSICKESFSLVTIEAFSYGVPVIGSNHGGVSELVREGENGYLFQNNNANDLLDKIKLLDENYDIIADNINAFDYSFEKQVENYLSIY